MNPEEITLSNLSKSFEYTKIANKIDDCSSLDDLRDMAKCFANKAEALKAAKQFCRESNHTDFEPEMVRPIEFENTKKGILGLINSIERDIVENYGGGYIE